MRVMSMLAAASLAVALSGCAGNPAVPASGTAVASSSSSQPGSTAPAQGVVTITPVFSQVVVHTLPKGFRTVHENTQGSSYIREAVPEGETVHQWSQMVTLTGARDIALKSGMPPHQVVATLARGYMNNCQGAATEPMVASVINGHPAFGAWVGCGAVNGKPYGESAVILAIQGSRDYYTLQWAERRPASAGKAVFDKKLWLDRLNQLRPVAVCNTVPGKLSGFSGCLGGNSTN